MGKYGNLKIGDRYNNWEIISECTKNNYGKDSYWCRCVCGTVRYLEGRPIVLGLSKSCGCVRKVSEDVKKERIKKYKHNYFQENKEKIYERVKKKQKEQREHDYQLYGMDRYHIKSKYGLSIDDYEKMLSSQNYKCLICGCDISNRQNNPHIDHNHETNKIRGILCGNCNMGLGHFKDNLDILKNAIKYLEDTDG